MSDYTKPDMMTIGATGLRVMGGVVSEERNKELRGVRWREVVREMTEQDPTVGAILFAVEMLVRRVEWTMVPADDSPAASELADIYRGMLDDMEVTWEDTLAEILSMLPWGWSFFELLYKVREGRSPADPRNRSKRDDGRIGWRRWAIRSQDSLERWEFDEDGHVVAMTQQVMFPRAMRATIPLSKGLLFRTTSRKDNPEGVSILRRSWQPWYYKKHIQRIEAIGIERDLAGLPTAGVPVEWLLESATVDQKAALKSVNDSLATIRNDEMGFFTYPMIYNKEGKPLFEFKLASTGGQRSFDTDKTIARYDANIARSILAEFIFLGSQSTGSFALSKDKTDFFTWLIEVWCDSIAATINNDAILPLMEINGDPVDLQPTLTPSGLTPDDGQFIVDAIAKLDPTGLIDKEDPDVRAFVHTVIGLPQPKITEEQEEEDEGKEPPEEEEPEPLSEEEGDDEEPTTKGTKLQASEGWPGVSQVERALAVFDRLVPAEYQGLLEAEVAGDDD